MKAFSYIPQINEPSMYSGVYGRLNREWFVYVRRLLAGEAISRGLEHFEALRTALNPQATVIVNNKGERREIVPDYVEKTPSNLAIAQLGVLLFRSFTTELLTGVETDGFDTPSSILTPEGLVSFRWVLHTARVDGMGPDEAYVYAKALTGARA